MTQIFSLVRTPGGVNPSSHAEMDELNSGYTLAGGLVTVKTLTVDETAALSSKAPLVSPSFTAPALGTPVSGDLSNCTGDFSQFTGSPTFIAPALGTPVSGDLSNCTGDLSGFTGTPGKNAVINGDFRVWQRGTSFAAIAHAAFAPDRWQYGKSGLMVHTVARDTDVPTRAQSGHSSLYSLKVACTTVDASIAAGEYTVLYYRLEGVDFAQFNGGTAMLSFWVKSVRTGVHCIAIRNSGVDRSYVAEYTINATNTWEKKTIPITFNASGGTWDYSSGIGISIAWALACGTTFQTTKDAWQTGNFLGTANQVNACDSTDNIFRISQVQLERGSVATLFENEPIAITTMKCQRYYQRRNCGVGSYTRFCLGFTDGAKALRGVFNSLVEMRSTPTLSYSALADFLVDTAAGTESPSSIGIEQSTPTVFNIIAATAASTTNAPGFLVANNKTTSWIDFTSELT